MKSRPIEVMITYLEQTARPATRAQPVPRGQLAIMRAKRPPLHFYRYLYETVGGDYHWRTRLNLNDAELQDIVWSDDVYIYVLHVEGAPAGFCEIDGRNRSVAEIRFFGLMPDFIGRGFGRYFFAQILGLAWALEPETVRIETCTLDHPAALSLYQKFGFTVFDQRSGVVDIGAPSNLERPMNENKENATIESTETTS